MSSLTKNADIGKGADEELVNQELTIVKWRETHFRALLKHLPGQPRGTKQQTSLVENFPQEKTRDIIASACGITPQLVENLPQAEAIGLGSGKQWDKRG